MEEAWKATKKMPIAAADVELAHARCAAAAGPRLSDEQKLLADLDNAKLSKVLQRARRPRPGLGPPREVGQADRAVCLRLG